MKVLKHIAIILLIGFTGSCNSDDGGDSDNSSGDNSNSGNQTPSDVSISSGFTFEVNRIYIDFDKEIGSNNQFLVSMVDDGFQDDGSSISGQGSIIQFKIQVPSNTVTDGSYAINQSIFDFGIYELATTDVNGITLNQNYEYFEVISGVVEIDITSNVMELSLATSPTNGNINTNVTASVNTDTFFEYLE